MKTLNGNQDEEKKPKSALKAFGILAMVGLAEFIMIAIIMHHMGY